MAVAECRVNLRGRYGMFAPGGIALAMSVIVALFMKESPEKLGYPSVGDGKPKPKAAAPAAGAPRPHRTDVLDHFILI